MSNHRAASDLYPASILQIQDDPTPWGLRDTSPEDHHWRDPVALEIIAPVVGTLVLSPARVGSLSLVRPDEHDGWMPAFKLAFPHLYLPTARNLTAASPGYVLPSGTDLHELQEKVMDAMRGAGRFLTVTIDVVGGGIVVLNGAQLPFAVLAPAS